MVSEIAALLNEQMSHINLIDSFFNDNPFALFVMDLNGNFVAVNPAYERVAGYKATELSNLNYEMIVVKENMRQTDYYFTQAVKGQVQNYESALIHKNGNRVETTDTLVPIKVNHEVVGVYGVIRDITTQKMMQAQLRESEQRLAVAQRIAQLGNWEWNVITDKRIWSEQTYRIFGIRNFSFTLTRETFLSFVYEEDRAMVLKFMVDSVQGKPYDIEFRIVRLDGAIRVIHKKADVEFDPQGQLLRVFGTMQDITERKETEELLRKSEKLAVLGQMAAGVGHEIRNPLTSIKGFLQLLQTKVSGFDKFFEIMLSELNRINSIVSEFMYLSKPQATMFQSVDVKKLIYDILPLLEAEAAMNNVQIFTKIEGTVPPLTCEENQIKQVFINLLKNAIESMPDGGNVEIEIRTEGSQFVGISVIDQGCGIPKERISKLGEPFYSTKEKGNGLGMMVTHRIIENHKGRIDIDSEVGAGTAIHVVLPVAYSG